MVFINYKYQMNKNKGFLLNDPYLHMDKQWIILIKTESGHHIQPDSSKIYNSLNDAERELHKLNQRNIFWPDQYIIKSFIFDK